MKKTLLLAGVAGALFSLNAQAMDLSPYVGAKLRYSMMEPEFTSLDKIDLDDKVFGGSLAVGLSSKVSGGAIRTELEYSKNEDAEKTKLITYTDGITFVTGEGNFTVETQSLLLNGYFDIDTNTKFTPYIGAGIGYTRMKGELKFAGETASDHKNTFTWQIGAGLSYAVNDNVSLDAGWRYVDYGDFKSDGAKLETTANELYIGARYAF